MMQGPMEATHFFECRCTDFSHVIRLQMDPAYGEIYLETTLNNNAYIPLWRRIWLAIKYVTKRGHSHSYPAYDGFIIKEKDLDNLIETLVYFREEVKKSGNQAN